MLVGGLGLGYCEESSSDCECEVMNGVPCCIMRDIMHHGDDTW